MEPHVYQAQAITEFMLMEPMLLSVAIQQVFEMIFVEVLGALE